MMTTVRTDGAVQATDAGGQGPSSYGRPHRDPGARWMRTTSYRLSERAWCTQMGTGQTGQSRLITFNPQLVTYLEDWRWGIWAKASRECAQAA